MSPNSNSRKSSADTGEEVACDDRQHRIMLQLPTSVVRVLLEEQEIASEIKTPAQELAKTYRRWEEGTSPPVTRCGWEGLRCLNLFRAPALMDWSNTAEKQRNAARPSRNQ